MWWRSPEEWQCTKERKKGWTSHQAVLLSELAEITLFLPDIFNLHRAKVLTVKLLINKSYKVLLETKVVDHSFPSYFSDLLYTRNIMSANS